MDEDLKQALDTIIDLRASLQLAYFDRQELTEKGVLNTLRLAAEVLRKHRRSDDMMRGDRGF